MSQSERVLRSRGFQDRGGRKFQAVALQVARKKLRTCDTSSATCNVLSRHRYVHVARKFSLVQLDLKGLDNFVSLCTIYFLFIPNCTQNQQQQQQQQLLSFVTIIFVMLMILIQTTRKDVDNIVARSYSSYPSKPDSKHTKIATFRNKSPKHRYAKKYTNKSLEMLASLECV